MLAILSLTKDRMELWCDTDCSSFFSSSFTCTLLEDSFFASSSCFGGSDTLTSGKTNVGGLTSAGLKFRPVAYPPFDEKT